MNMRDHMLAAIREQFDEWNGFLEELSPNQINTPMAPSEWTVKDVLAHLAAWEQRSIARFTAARANQTPEMPSWVPEGEDPESDANLEKVNERIYRGYKNLSWEKVLEGWRDGYLKLQDLASRVEEPVLLNSDRFPWLDGYSLADVLLGAYDHHAEHLANVQSWMSENKK
jgi:hypothetical protein